MVSAYPVLAIILLRVTPSAKRNSYRVARGAHHPRCATYIIDIGKARHRRTSYIHALEHHTHHDETVASSGNSVGVAKGAHHPQWTTHIIVIPLQHQRVEYYMHSVTLYRPTPPYYIYRAHLTAHGVTLNRPTPPYYIYRAHLSAHTGARKSPRPGEVGALDVYERLNSIV